MKKITTFCCFSMVVLLSIVSAVIDRICEDLCRLADWANGKNSRYWKNYKMAEAQFQLQQMEEDSKRLVIEIEDLKIIIASLNTEQGVK